MGGREGREELSASKSRSRRGGPSALVPWLNTLKVTKPDTQKLRRGLKIVKTLAINLLTFIDTSNKIV
ncbi:hypothetical protein E2C01_053802 [Portunus trituberculatus]|uniref:Uncharacterized protein n=1 Tax=Portunus trituberculatus TaxID=210409 RepID=A0A5B7GT91_PORTR|nr:hypothetical protein [Portunus trituberculatus]